MKTKHATLTLEKFNSAPRESIQNFLSQLDRKATVTFVFLGSEEFIPELENFLKDWDGVVCACTTGGEIVEGKYLDSSLVGMSISSDKISCKSLHFDLGLITNGSSPIIDSASEEIQRFRADVLLNEPSTKFFSTMVIDRMAGKEELFVNAFHKSILNIPFIGGSAGDNYKFHRTFVFDGECFKQNTANVLVFASELPFEIFKTQDFEITEKRMVITESDPTKRVVLEIDGMPATKAYADAINLKESDLNLSVFANHPIIVSYGGESYIRSILGCNDRGELEFACAIETGVVVRLGKRTGTMVEDLKTIIDGLDFEVDASLVFECSLRRNDILKASEDEKNRLLELFNQINAVGFHTYGEQFNSVHINQTLTGLLIGHSRA